MKHTKLLLSLSLILGFMSTKAQSFFIDNAVYYTLSTFISMNGPSLDFFEETIQLDSVNNTGEHYTIQRSEYIRQGLNNNNQPYTYQLRVLNDSVFFTGKNLFYIENDFPNIDSLFLDNVLIYDFTMQASDTFTVEISEKLQYLIDSIAVREFSDGAEREVQYIKELSFPNLSTEFIKGIGSLSGLSNRIGNEYLMYEVGEDTRQLMSVCVDGDAVYSKEPEVYYTLNGNSIYWELTDYCNQDSLVSYLEKFEKNFGSVAKINQGSQVVVYPNPASSEISFKEVQSGTEYKILNSLGSEVLSGVYDGNSISVSDLASGIYLIQVNKSRVVFQARFVKE